MWYVLSFALFGLLAGFIIQRWWVVVAFTLTWTVIESSLGQYGGELGPLATAMLFAVWPFAGAVIGVLLGRAVAAERG